MKFGVMRFVLVLALALAFSPVAFAATQNLTVDSCSQFLNTVVISNCDGLNSLDDTADITIAKNSILNVTLSNTSFSGTISSVTATIRHGGDPGITGNVGVTFFDALNGNAFCAEDTTIPNTVSYTTDTILSCTPIGGWTTARLDNLQIRIKNNDTGTLTKQYLSYIVATVTYGVSQSCGNDAREGTEICDGTDLNSQTCATLGFSGGTLSCQPNCSAFDTSGCLGGGVCGDGIITPPEVCDGTDLNSQTCFSQGFSGGTIGCADDCLRFNTENCFDAAVSPPSTGGGCGMGCCGNGTCDADSGEDYGTCRTDCPVPRHISFEWLGPLSQQEFAAGEEVKMRVRLKADSVVALNAADFNASGGFGTVSLRDNGVGVDENRGDGIYSGSFIAKDDRNTVLFAPIELRAVVAQTVGLDTGGYQFVPALAIQFGTSKKNYSLGDIVKISGRVARNKQPVAIDLNAVIKTEDEKNVLETVIRSAADGSFSENFQTTTIHPAGKWLVTVSAADPLGNRGFLAREIILFEPKANAPISIRLLDESAQQLERGKRVKLSFAVLDEYGEHVERANVSLTTPSGETIALKETGIKTYTGFLTVPFDLQTTVQNFEIRAKKQTAYSVLSGSARIPITIAETALFIKLVEPVQSGFNIGDEIPLKLQVSYENGEPVTEPQITVRMAQKPVVFTAIDRGLFAATYFVAPEDTGKIFFTAKATDQFQNSGEYSKELFVSNNYSLNYFVKTNPAMTGIALIALVGFMAWAGVLVWNNFQTGQLEKKIKISKMKTQQLDEKYFKFQTINKQNYAVISGQLNAERTGLEKKLEKLKGKKT